MWSRDAFEDLLRALATAQGGRIHIVAHSMGTLLTLETLRMLRADAGEAALDRIGAIVLAAPDIDIDLFTNGIERLGTAARNHGDLLHQRPGARTVEHHRGRGGAGRGRPIAAA